MKCNPKIKKNWTFSHVPVKKVISYRVRRILRSHQSLGELYRRLQHSAYANVTVYNGLFIQTGNEIKDMFKDQIKKYYDSYVTNVDFGQSEATNAINKWENYF